VASVGSEAADCAKDETDTKNELDKRWSQFGASDKRACVGESSIGGDQSYVELLTCLEMSSGEFSAGRQIGKAQSTDTPETPSEHTRSGLSK
jgi:hypothetical protein